ncbi:integrating conjugative element protein (plasmid) [Rhizobium sp. ACO-34A]|nr:TIGR03759 family integrating conjugative element protein [Rhizobium sp. ACO-34A]ATN36811.1 integrating conjugative element protein [Rhizobium sp. ACO-34A]
MPASLHCTRRIILSIALSISPSVLLSDTANAEDASATSSTILPSREQPGFTGYSDTQKASDWGLREEEWTRYRSLMQGPLGVYSPNLDPLTTLGIEASTDEERRRYAELQVGIEARRVARLLAYQRAYDDAWQRLHPGMERVGASLADLQATPAGSGRLAVFVKDKCPACGQAVQRLQSAGTEFDLYMVGTRQDDARIRDWAKGIQIDPVRVRSGAITLNHDSGRWLSLGLEGDLPAVVRQVNGQWQRQ